MYNVFRSLIQTIRDVSSGSPEAIQDLPLDSAMITNEVPTHVSIVFDWEKTVIYSA